MSSLTSPQYAWWGPFPRHERIWLLLITLSAVLLSAITLGWIVAGKQNVPAATYQVAPAEFEAQVAAFTAKYQIAGSPNAVRVPPGEDAYLLAKMWSFGPELHLKAGEPYTIWVSATDVLHGFTIADQNLNLTVSPGHAYGIRITPETPGTYLILCSEYCGVGHHVMMGKIIVE
jgi:cytochrome c oxidase subunit II